MTCRTLRRHLTVASVLFTWTATLAIALQVTQTQITVSDNARASPRRLLVLAVSVGEQEPRKLPTSVMQYQANLSLPISNERLAEISTVPKIRKKRRLLRFFRQNTDIEEKVHSMRALSFSYGYDLMEVGSHEAVPRTESTNTTGIILIHPIGVGIAKWYYDRLFASMARLKVNESTGQHRRILIVAPDLLGSGSACNASLMNFGTNSPSPEVSTFPLFNISDWTCQVGELMSTLQRSYSVDQWCVVANGGCSPIALQVAANTVKGNNKHRGKVSNVVLSSVPRLPFFLKPSNDVKKVKKSYRFLCGLPGRLFWWYACRNGGSFIQKFSEKNLVADPNNLGEEWLSNCYENAIRNSGRSKYSTFAFLAGTLQDGCLKSLDELKDSEVAIDIIKGGDVRRNRARSWFWQNPRGQKMSERDTPPVKTHETLRDYVAKNNCGGREVTIGGRISLAYEDPDGYSDALWEFLR